MTNEVQSWHPVVIGPSTNYLECIKWCREQFGLAPTVNLYVGQDWVYRPSSRYFEFKHEQDAILFVLRWS